MTEDEATSNLHCDILKKIESDNRREAASQGVSYEVLMHGKIKEKHGNKSGQQIINTIEKCNKV